MDKLQIITSTKTVAEIKESAKELFLSGELDVLDAWRNMTAYAKAVEELKKDPEVRDAALRELEKYGKSTDIYGCKMEVKEVGVKYDYSECGDNELIDLYSDRDAINDQIKERESILRAIKPGFSFMAVVTGQEFRAPVKTSTTTIQVTFKK